MKANKEPLKGLIEFLIYGFATFAIGLSAYWVMGCSPRAQRPEHNPTPNSGAALFERIQKSKFSGVKK